MIKLSFNIESDWIEGVLMSSFCTQLLTKIMAAAWILVDIVGVIRHHNFWLKVQAGPEFREMWLLPPGKMKFFKSKTYFNE